MKKINTKKLKECMYLLITNGVIWYIFLSVLIPYSSDVLGVQNHRRQIVKPAEAKVEQVKEYKYNEQVPEEVILEELYTLADRFNLIGDNWEKLVRCEATGKDGKIDNLICNPTSTACGPSQYLIRTWYATESWKQFRCARTDHRCSLWEMALDLANGEEDKWSECNKIIGIYNYTK